VSRALETITRNARQQTRLIEDLLDLSAIVGGRLRLQTGPMSLVASLGAALETIRPEAERKGVTIRTRLDPAVDTVSGDPQRLQQVFWNLLSNAVKFTGRGGRVDLRLERIGARAVVTVSDTGIGIRPDLLGAIFERFRQADGSIARVHGGLGLGLAIVKQLVELHGGTVAAASPGEGQGATFTVVFPLATADTERPVGPAGSPDSSPSRCAGAHALVVDDEPDGRDMVAVFLHQAGARVTAAASASEGLAEIRRSRPDVLITDLAMPGMDGYELMRQVRASFDVSQIPAIALTAHVSAEARIRAFQAGFDAYVAKPVDREELLSIVARLTHRRDAAPPG
jgi:CheY-like chemotaxis protein